MKMQDILKIENISIHNLDLDWEEAVRLAASPLVEGGYVEERYPEEIIKNTKEFGPYFVLGSELAFLHVRPEQGVLKDQVAVMVNKKTVEFLEDDRDKDVRFFLTFAATGSDKHLEIMQLLAEILSDEEKIKNIIEAETEEQIYKEMVE